MPKSFLQYLKEEEKVILCLVGGSEPETLGVAVVRIKMQTCRFVIFGVIRLMLEC